MTSPNFTTTVRSGLSFSLLFLTLFVCKGFSINRVIVYPAPRGEVLSNHYRVVVSGKIVPIYLAKIGSSDDKKRFLAVDDLLNSEKYYDTAAFGYFDFEGVAKVNLFTNNIITSVKILPLGAVSNVTTHKNIISFIVNKPQNLTIEINKEDVKSLHLFVNPIEKNTPSPRDTNVIFFGPGIHKIGSQLIGNNKMVYIAGGAIVKCTIGKNERFGVEPSGLRNYEPRFYLKGRNIIFRGRGILDAGDSPVHAGNVITIDGNDIKLEGIIIRNSCGWTIPVRRSSNVIIDNIKILGYRANTDGIDICNSRNVLVENCFIRTNDDLIVVKTWEGEGEAKDIVVRNCVLWNPLAHALSLGAELRENVSNVLFTDCDIIHDKGREWTLRIFHSDSSNIANIRFENLRILESRNLISVWIGKNIHSLKKESGTITGVKFRNITAIGEPLIIRLDGYDEQHKISDVNFTSVVINNCSLLSEWVIKNQFVEKVKISN